MASHDEYAADDIPKHESVHNLPVRETHEQNTTWSPYSLPPHQDGIRTLRVLVLHGSHYSPSSEPLVDLLLVSITAEESDHPSATLDAKFPDFEAVSYAWGETKTDRNLRCTRRTPIQYDPEVPFLQILEHSLPHERIEFSQTVYDIIVDLQPRTGYRLIWLDALCINQRDTVDRKEQVNLMRVVYGNAKRVIVWLPCQLDSSMDEETRTKLNARIVVNKLSSVEPLLNRHSSFRYDHSTQVPQAIDKQLFVPQSEISILGKLLAQPWFDRTWVI
ncbi:heterokaryon incompatibility protein-domain-containing protein [Paraphoma chrysanthemicola]|uniref:Heterokaryon incompatibility protein-domain-containing protein n=1 Tax=Paraphoma chrysanthemicola TaxID=798071 RepID=A0A8K0VZT3_9PLEO|nr:heterokaryon incompatibility protein-domain-containing protein [Paraphoma chrysanthemicola]